MTSGQQNEPVAQLSFMEFARVPRVQYLVP